MVSCLEVGTALRGVLEHASDDRSLAFASMLGSNDPWQCCVYAQPRCVGWLVGMKMDRIRMDITDIVFVFIFVFEYGVGYG